MTGGTRKNPGTALRHEGQVAPGSQIGRLCVILCLGWGARLWWDGKSAVPVPNRRPIFPVAAVGWLRWSTFGLTPGMARRITYLVYFVKAKGEGR